MFFILSPAKSLNEQTQPPTTTHTQPTLLTQAAQLASILKQKSPADLQQLMNISAELADVNARRYHNWHTPFTVDNAKQAIFLFAGDVYTGIDAYQQSEEILHYLQQHVGILSGLYGILRPLDLIQPYRLEMGTKLANPLGNSLYAYWGKQITMEINHRIQQVNTEHNQNDPTLINLASNEYYKTVSTQELKAKIITPRFEDEKNGQYKVISFYAKKARGLMVRYAATHNLIHATSLKNFDLDGYHFCAEISDDINWVFRRTQAHKT